MRLSRRERFLVTMLMLLLLWTGFYKLWAGLEMFRILWEWEEGKDLEIRVRAKGTGNKKDNSRLLEKLENAGKGQIYFADMSPDQMDIRLQDLAGASHVQLVSLNIGETKAMETEGYVYTTLSLEFLCTTRDQAAAFVDNIGKEGSALCISSLKLEQAEENLKGFMEVSYCHEQKK